MSKRKECSPCLVCGATERTASHFGSTACMACASFFRRTVSFGIRFLCKVRNNCSISSDVRLTCRSCRYDNCIRAGMRKDLVQQKRNDDRLPKYVLESRASGVTEVVRGYTTCKHVNYSDECSSLSSSPDIFEFSTILNVSHDELLHFYIRQVQNLDSKTPYEKRNLNQFLINKRMKDQVAVDLCTSCPGSDLLDKSDLDILFRYCSFASLWMDDAWINAHNYIPSNNNNNKSSTPQDVFDSFVHHFESTVTSELCRLQLDLVEYSALKSFCIWKLGILDSTLTLKIVAQEQYFGVTTALGNYYQNKKCMESFEIATRLADITLILGPIFNTYQDSLKMYDHLNISNSLDGVSSP